MSGDPRALLEDGGTNSLGQKDGNLLTTADFPARAFTFDLNLGDDADGDDVVSAAVVVFSNLIQVSLTSVGKPGVFLEVTSKATTGKQVSFPPPKKKNQTEGADVSPN